MEATGHYYTVYYISLAVGFPNNEAQKIAFYTQMADQVHELDAANQEKSQAVKLLPAATIGATIGAVEGLAVGVLIAIAITAASGGGAIFLGVGVLVGGGVGGGVGGIIGGNVGIITQETLSSETRTANEWRLTIEYGLHALTGKSPEDERKITTDLLKSTSESQPIRVGLLIHRLGDTYAHTMPSGKYLHKSSESMANLIERGHLWEGTHADHGWERQTIFFSYIDNLYEVLNERAAKSMVGRTNTLPLTEIKRFFTEVFKIAQNIVKIKVEEMGYFDRIAYEDIKLLKPLTGTYDKHEQIEKEAQKIIIGHMKNEVKEKFKVVMDSYSPDKEPLMTLDVFLNRHSITNKAGRPITIEDIKNIVRTIAQNVASKE